MSISGYNSLISLANFSIDDIENLESFTINKLPNIIQLSHENKIKFYRNYTTSPEKFNVWKCDNIFEPYLSFLIVEA